MSKKTRLEKKKIRADIKKTRIQARTERKANRQQGKTDRTASRQEARKTAFEHGIDPGAKWANVANTAIVTGGAVALGGIAGKTVQNVNKQNKASFLSESQQYDDEKQAKGGLSDKFFGFINKNFDKEKVV